MPENILRCAVVIGDGTITLQSPIWVVVHMMDDAERRAILLND